MSGADWKVGKIPTRVEFDGNLVTNMVAGWTWGVWGLDFRVYRDDAGELAHGWALTHCPTGLSLAGLLMPLPEAMALVARIDAIGDWNFSDLAQSRPLAPAWLALRDQFADDIVRDPARFSPNFRRAAGALQ